MASSGFNNQATPFLKNFPNEILQESELENWINKVIQENKTLSVIDLTKVKEPIIWNTVKYQNNSNNRY